MAEIGDRMKTFCSCFCRRMPPSPNLLTSVCTSVSAAGSYNLKTGRELSASFGALFQKVIQGLRDGRITLNEMPKITNEPGKLTDIVFRLGYGKVCNCSALFCTWSNRSGGYRETEKIYGSGKNTHFSRFNVSPDSQSNFRAAIRCWRASSRVDEWSKISSR